MQKLKDECGIHIGPCCRHNPDVPLSSVEVACAGNVSDGRANSVTSMNNTDTEGIHSGPPVRGEERGEGGQGGGGERVKVRREKEEGWRWEGGNGEINQMGRYQVHKSTLSWGASQSKTCVQSGSSSGTMWQPGASCQCAIRDIVMEHTQPVW